VEKRFGVLESSGKVLEFIVSKRVGTLSAMKTISENCKAGIYCICAVCDFSDACLCLPLNVSLHLCLFVDIHKACISGHVHIHTSLILTVLLVVVKRYITMMCKGMALRC